MQYYKLYSSPAKEAIDYNNNSFLKRKTKDKNEPAVYLFSILVSHIDGNTVRINNVYNILPELKEELSEIIIPGVELYLERFKYITKYYIPNVSSKDKYWQKMIAPVHASSIELINVIEK